jgi:hypothetical protein
VPFKRRSDPLCEKAPARVQYSEHLEGDGAAIFAHVCQLGAEGIVSKAARSPVSRWAEQGVAQDQESDGARHAAVPGGAVTSERNYLAAALHSAGRLFSQ